LTLTSGGQVTQQRVFVSVEPAIDGDGDGLSRYEEEVLVGNSDSPISVRIRMRMESRTVAILTVAGFLFMSE